MAEIDRRDNHRRGDDNSLRKLVEQQGAIIARQRKALKSAVVGYIILSVGIAAGLYAIEHRDAGRARNAEAVSLRAQVAACERVNLLRAQANSTSEISFATLYASAQRERALAHGPNARTHVKSADTLAYLASKTLHTGLTDCHQAVYDAVAYRRPVPVAFDPKNDPLLRVIFRKIGR